MLFIKLEKLTCFIFLFSCTKTKSFDRSELRVIKKFLKTEIKILLRQKNIYLYVTLYDIIRSAMNDGKCFAIEREQGAEKKSICRRVIGFRWG